jgi:hypothetical protein
MEKTNGAVGIDANPYTLHKSPGDLYAYEDESDDAGEGIWSKRRRQHEQ